MNIKSKYRLSSIDQVIKDASEGKLFILVDDEDRENEGDLCILSNWISAESINFMAKYGRGLICLALTKEKTNSLGLSMMERKNESRHQTAFTVSIEAREGVTTGISAADRAKTILTAIDPNSTEKDITTPGHVFPLVSRDGGTLVRAGHTEAVVDIARATGSKNPSGVICEIMKDNGEMARLPDLIKFAKKYKLKIASIADLIKWRRKNETLITRLSEKIIFSEFGGEWRVIVYRNDISLVEHIVLIKGEINSQKEIYVRMHSIDLMIDILGIKNKNKKFGELQKVMQMIAKKGNGIIVLLRENSSLSIEDILNNDADNINFKNNQGLRDYGVGAQILNDLNVKKMILLSNSKPNVISLDGYGLKIIKWKSIC